MSTRRSRRATREQSAGTVNAGKNPENHGETQSQAAFAFPETE